MIGNNPSPEQEKTPQREVDLRMGMVLVAFNSDVGPYIDFADSPLDQNDLMFLAIRGYTALMIGVDYGDDQSRIRGSLQVPNTPYDAIGFDIIVDASDEQSGDPRSVFSPMLLFVIVERDLLADLKGMFADLESFLRKQVITWKKKEDLNQERLSMLSQRTRGFIRRKLSQVTKPRLASLYDVQTLLALPEEIRKTAQALLALYYSNKGKMGVSCALVADRTGRSPQIEQEYLEALVRRGLVEGTHTDDKTIVYKPFSK